MRFRGKRAKKATTAKPLSILFMRFMGNVSVPTKKARFAFNSLYEIQY